MTLELVDTSAWTAQYRDPVVAASFAMALEEGQVATCGPARFELLVATRDETELAARTILLDSLPQVHVGVREWERAEEVLRSLARLGPLHHRQVPMPDVLLAAAAERVGMPVLHYDRHFELIASVTGQPVRAIAPLGSL